MLDNSPEPGHWKHFLSYFSLESITSANFSVCSRATGNYAASLLPFCFPQQPKPLAESVNERSRRGWRRRETRPRPKDRTARFRD